MLRGSHPDTICTVKTFQGFMAHQCSREKAQCKAMMGRCSCLHSQVHPFFSSEGVLPAGQLAIGSSPSL